MINLFYAFGAGWVGTFLCLFALLRRSAALEREVRALRDRPQRAAGSATLPR